MGLGRWKTKFDRTVKAATEITTDALKKVSSSLDTNITLEDAQKELANDLEKGLRIFDNIGLPEGEADDIQENLATHIMQKLETCFPGPDKKETEKE